MEDSKALIAKTELGRSEHPPSPPHGLKITDLPNEILIAIVSHFPFTKIGWLHLCLVNHRFNEIMSTKTLPKTILELQFEEFNQIASAYYDGSPTRWDLGKAACTMAKLTKWLGLLPDQQPLLQHLWRTGVFLFDHIGTISAVHARMLGGQHNQHWIFVDHMVSECLTQEALILLRYVSFTTLRLLLETESALDVFQLIPDRALFHADGEPNFQHGDVAHVLETTLLHGGGGKLINDLLLHDSTSQHVLYLRDFLEAVGDGKAMCHHLRQIIAPLDTASFLLSIMSHTLSYPLAKASKTSSLIPPKSSLQEALPGPLFTTWSTQYGERICEAMSNGSLPEKLRHEVDLKDISAKTASMFRKTPSLSMNQDDTNVADYLVQRYKSLWSE